MNNSLVSIAMCTYNGQRFIKEQLDSLLNQTHTNIELVITDDCSTDDTINIINSYKKRDKRIQLYQNEKNLGFVKNFEKAIYLCTGDYIALADQDDIWKENKIELFLNEIKENILIYSDAILIDDKGKELGSELIRPTNNLIQGSLNKAFIFTNCVSGNTLLFKKELVDYILPMPNKISYHDRWIAFVASTLGTISFTQESMTYYRRYPEQITVRVEKSYKGFFDKFKQKKQSRLKDAQILIDDLKAFLSLSILKDAETIELLKLLLKHNTNYANIYYDKKLHKILKKYQNEIFAMVKKKIRNKRAFRTAIGLKFRTVTLFKL